MFREHFLSTSDPELWRSYLPASRSVFGSLGYARICEAFRSCSPRLYVLERGNAVVCYPLTLRALAELPFRVETLAKWDSATPDFTGPLLFGDDSEIASVFLKQRDARFHNEGIVAEFAHVHPWSQAQQMLGAGCIYNRDLVWVDVTLDPEELWRNHFDHSCRKNIKRAEKEGVRVFTASEDAHLREFYRIYRLTMEKNNALPGYYFSLEFCRAFQDELPDNARFVMAEYNGHIVAGTLYLHDQNDVFAFLGGADPDFQHVRPTNAVVWETIRWAHRAGKQRLILGGGYRPDDGIFRFKATFSRLRQPFYIYKQIHLRPEYEQFELRCRQHHGLNGEPIGYFPAYRYVPAGEKTTARVTCANG
jgi:hypothetical protein